MLSAGTFPAHILQTGQKYCYSEQGAKIPCPGSGQDAELLIGTAWPEPRFSVRSETVLDQLTGLVWSRDANPGQFPCTWQQAFDLVDRINSKHFAGFNDWRLPNRRELRSLMDYQQKKPPLPAQHRFTNIFLYWYWTSTTAAIHPSYAWAVHLEGARMFYNKKTQEAMCWPVRGQGNGMLAATGQKSCWDSTGTEITGQGSGQQDGELRFGVPWPEPRFRQHNGLVQDQLTGLTWLEKPGELPEKMKWQQALDLVMELNSSQHLGRSDWHLPTINELESLVDAEYHSPALSSGHPFSGLRDGYWSSTTSYFETDWAWVLYLDKGACGVGYKPDPNFSAWPVSSG
jgi:hypothetical protein